MPIFYLIAFLASACLTYLIRRYALNKSLLDIPNARSSHTHPTPRGGGLAIVVTFLSLVFILQSTGFVNIAYPKALSILLGSLAIAGIGFWDDHQHIPARWRFAVHSLASAGALIFLPALPHLPFFGTELDLAAFSFIFYTLALVWLINLYNFMDGIDGIASSEFISVTLSASVLLSFEHQGDWLFPLLLITAAVSGFLVWNWAGAKIFMGDVGSGFLGFVLGISAILTALYTELNLWCWLILLGIFICDSSFTLIKRYLSGQVWYEAHCSHAYQRYAKQQIDRALKQGLNSKQARTQAHRKINYLLLALNLGWLLPCAGLAMSYPQYGFLISSIAYTPLIFIAQQLKAGSAV